MRRLLYFAVLLALPVLAHARPGTATKYRPANLFGGYKEKEVEPGVWRVEARANGIAEEGFARNMAVYRAADIMRSANFAYFQVIDQKGKTTRVGFSAGSMNNAGETMTLWVRGADRPDRPTDCRVKMPGLCFTLPVARTMERVRPLLTFPGDGS